MFAEIYPGFEKLTELATREVPIEAFRGQPMLDKVYESFVDAYMSVEKLISDLAKEGSPKWLKARSALEQVKSRVTVKPLQPGTGAEYDPMNHLIRLNAGVLSHTQQELTRYLKHEFIHAIGIMDESVTDWVAQYMDGDDQVRTGYFQLVEKLNERAKGMSVLDLLSEYQNEDEQTIANLIYTLFVPEELSEKGLLTAEEIEIYIYDTIPELRKLFPRLINRVFATYRGFHEEADVSEKELVETVAKRMQQRQLIDIRDKGQIFETVDKLFRNSQAPDLVSFLEFIKAQRLEWLLQEEDFQIATFNYFEQLHTSELERAES